METQIKKKGFLQKNKKSATAISVEAPKPCSTRPLPFHLQRRPKPLEPTMKSAPLKKVIPRSQENEFSHKPMTNQWQSCKINTKPTMKSTQRSKLSSVKVNVSTKSKKKRIEEKELETKMKISGEQQPIEILLESNYCSSFDNNNNTPGGKLASGENVGDNLTSVRTPPVEVSESPEINSLSKMVVSKSVATPVCYGAGHHLSGVTDKRKCRRRGSLKGGCEKAKLFDDEISDVNVINDLHDPSIPLLVEASVRLELSPCNEGLFSPLVNDGSNYTKDSCLSDLNEKNLRDNVSALSLGYLSSRNVIQTPNSNSSLDRRNFDDFELDLIRETLNRVSLSPKSDMSICDSKSMDLGGYTQLKENADSVCSWVSDSTVLDNLRLSRMKISWRDELISGVDEKDEFDCCRCLSDEEIGIKSGVRSHLGTELCANKENDVKTGSDLWPTFLEYEPCIRARGDGKLSPHMNNMCAESICTNGGDLVASGDSDWTYFLP